MLEVICSDNLESKMLKLDKDIEIQIIGIKHYINTIRSKKFVCGDSKSDYIFSLTQITKSILENDLDGAIMYVDEIINVAKFGFKSSNTNNYYEMISKFKHIKDSLKKYS